MFDRSLIIAENTWKELLHKKVLYFLAGYTVLAFILPLIVVLEFSSAMGSDANASSLILALVRMFFFVSFILCFIQSSMLVDNEISKRTLTTVMICPVHRWEYLFGRFLGVAFLYLVFIITALLCGYIASALTGGGFPVTFLWGVLQRVFYGVSMIMITTCLGAVLSGRLTMAMVIVVFMLNFISLLIPNDANLGLMLGKNMIYYLTPAAGNIDFIDGQSPDEGSSTLFNSLALLENIFYAAAVFFLCANLFGQKDIKLREE